MENKGVSLENFSYKPNAKESIARLRAFWQKDLVDHPPVRIRFPMEGVSDEQWQQSCEDEKTHFTYWENLIEQKRRIDDDDMLVAPVYHGPAFMGGVLGAPISFGMGTSWNEHIFSDYDQIDTLRDIVYNETNPWLNTMKRHVEYFSEQAHGRFPVGTNLFTGPADIMGALRGITELYMDIALNPEEVKKLAVICTEAFIQTTQYCFDLIPSLEGGYCDYYSLWTPGRSCMVDNDLSVGLSPEDYHNVLFPFDCQAMESMETAWMHTHSAQIRLVPEFLKIPALKAIQVVNDWPAGPTVQEMLPMFKLIQQNHCLLLRKFSPEDLQMIHEELDPAGLYVDTQCDSLEDAQRFLQTWGNSW
jgi:hypothetical protein